MPREAARQLLSHKHREKVMRDLRDYENGAARFLKKPKKPRKTKEQKKKEKEEAAQRRLEESFRLTNELLKRERIGNAAKKCKTV